MKITKRYTEIVIFSVLVLLLTTDVVAKESLQSAEFEPQGAHNYIPTVDSNVSGASNILPPAPSDFDFSAELQQISQTNSDLAFYMNQENGWKLYGKKTLDLTVDQFWYEFLDENSPFGLENLDEVRQFKEVSITPWQGSKRVLTLVAPVEGVPFIDKTRVTRTITLVKRSASEIVIDIESQCHDAPYGDTFRCKESWVVLGSQKDPNHQKIQLSQFYQVKFVKYTFFKSRIEPPTQEGIVEGINKWNQQAEEHGLFDKWNISKTENGSNASDPDVPISSEYLHSKLNNAPVPPLSGQIFSPRNYEYKILI